MYWTDLHTADPSVEWAYLNGSDPQELADVNMAVKSPTNVAVDLDPTNNLVYWTDLDMDDYDRITVYDETDSYLTDFPLSNVFGLAIHGEFVYWTHQGAQYTLGRANKITGEGREEVVGDRSGLRALTAVNMSAAIGMTPLALGSLPPPSLLLATLVLVAFFLGLMAAVVAGNCLGVKLPMWPTLNDFESPLIFLSV